MAIYQKPVFEKTAFVSNDAIADVDAASGGGKPGGPSSGFKCTPVNTTCCGTNSNTPGCSIDIS